LHSRNELAKAARRVGGIVHAGVDSSLVEAFQASKELSKRAEKSDDSIE
jgi:hypothetical protein